MILSQPFRAANASGRAMKANFMAPAEGENGSLRVIEDCIALYDAILSTLGFDDHLCNGGTAQAQIQQLLTQQRALKHRQSGLPFDRQQIAYLLLADQGFGQKVAFALTDADDVQQPVFTLRRQPVTDR